MRRDSDHGLDYAELASNYRRWREEKLRAIGPVGLQTMADGCNAMQATEIAECSDLLIHEVIGDEGRNQQTPE